jgi:hypothetical protein
MFECSDGKKIRLRGTVLQTVKRLSGKRMTKSIGSLIRAKGISGKESDNS